MLLKLIMPAPRKICNINDSVGINLLTRLRLGFTHQREHKFGHSFRDILNPRWSCSIKAKTTTHYFLRCYFYKSNMSARMNDFNEIHSSFSKLNDNDFIFLVYDGSDKFDEKNNHNILMSTIKFFMKISRRLEEHLL